MLAFASYKKSCLFSQLLGARLRTKEKEWNQLLQMLKEKELVAARLRRRSQVLRYRTGDADAAVPQGGDCVQAMNGVMAQASVFKFILPL